MHGTPAHGTASFSTSWTPSSSSSALSLGETTWRNPGAPVSGSEEVPIQKFQSRPQTSSVDAGGSGGGGQAGWQEDYVQGHDPLKGKHFNDVIIAKHSGGEILNVVEESMNEFSVVNAVTALHRLAKTEDAHAWRRDPRIKYLNRRITKMFASAKRDEVEKKETGRRVPGNDWVYYIDTRSLTNAAWAFAQLHLRHDELLEAISEETCKKIYDSNAQQLAILSWSFAKMLRVVYTSAVRCTWYQLAHLLMIP
jgi:hypothetical protein